MTAAPDPTPNGATCPNPSHHEARQHDHDAVLVGDVPIAVWRLDDHDDTDPSAAPGSRLASRLAQRLVLVYTRRGDTIVDFDSDPTLEHASVRTSRSYLSITDPTTVADLDALLGPVSLVVLRWPPRHTRTPTAITDLFTACRLIMTTDACAIAAVSSAAPGQPGTTYAEHLDELLPAARAVGLNHVRHIVVVRGTDTGDEFLYYASEAEASREKSRADEGGNHPMELLVFTAGQWHNEGHTMVLAVTPP
ncbi:hypothetical protein AB0J14_34755 [Micromonospora arborensis]|uniref:hypothetical protein n=1 Tax=Micromonospora arborensis TaxID=2116518 RepID=UPI00340D6BCA